jgi:hypothetical protein
MARRTEKYWIYYVSTLLFLLILNIYPIHAADELFLTGVVKHYDSARGLVTVEVRSKSCPGTMTFRPENAVVDLEGSEGKKISFFINASTCDPNNIHTMRGITFPRGHLK